MLREDRLGTAQADLGLEPAGASICGNEDLQWFPDVFVLIDVRVPGTGRHELHDLIVGASLVQLFASIAQGPRRRQRAPFAPRAVRDLVRIQRVNPENLSISTKCASTALGTSGSPVRPALRLGSSFVAHDDAGTGPFHGGILPVPVGDRCRFCTTRAGASIGVPHADQVRCIEPVREDEPVSSDAAPDYAPNDLLSRLVGFRLFSVQFVLDYVQLRFDGAVDDMPVLNCDVMPRVERGGRTITDGQIGYADSLRGLIPGVVRQTREETGHGLRVEFDDGAIVVHPSPADLVGPEIALLQGFEDHQWMCWRPGEDSFEDLG